MYKMVIFDLDGTICDTLRDLANCVNMSLKKNGLKIYEVEEYRMFVGNGIDNLVKTVLAEKKDDKELFDKVKKGFQENYAIHLLDYTTDYPGLNDLFKKIQNNDIVFGVISNKPDQFVPVILSEIYPDIVFPFSIGKKEEFSRKPAPDSLISYISRYDMKTNDVLYVGDSNVDIIYAHNAGVDVCAVTWGFRTEKELKEAGADYIAHNVQELSEVIFSNA